MSKSVWTSLAESELDEVLFHIAVRSGRPSTGEQNYFAIRQLADEYAREGAPRHRHPVAPADWFYFLHKRWLIFYQLHAEGIEVMWV
jgi:plasmid stabilization system protein ParE